jgi:Polyphosphate kinase C-terminal domain 2
MATAVLASIGDHGDELLALPIPSLRDPDWTPLWPPALDHKADAIFHAIQSADLLVHHLTGHADKPNCTSLLVAPLTMRPRLLDLIHRETQNQRAGLPARIIAKMNQVEDPDIIEALCEAFAGWCVDRFDHSRLLLPSPGSPRPHRKHPHPFHHRALPRTLAYLVLRRWQAEPCGR